MESGSVLSEPFTNNRGLTAAERSVSMTILNPVTSPNGKPRMSHLETLEAKMANIEVSLSSASVPRRRKGTSLGGGSTISARTSPRPSIADVANNNMNPAQKEHRTAVQDREAVIQNLRLQLGLGKLPRPTGTPLDEAERPAAEQRLTRLRNDAENKRIAIRNLKAALEKLDVTDNIDVRIRQAELEYALGREELQLLSLVEETRALQSRLEKSTKMDGQNNNHHTLYNQLQAGANLSLQSAQVTVGRFAATIKQELPGFYVEWVADGEPLQRGDRILEVNGHLLIAKTQEEFQEIIGTSGKCQLVVIRKRPQQPSQQKLIQSQEDNLRLQHRISYLEDQVKEMQDSTKEIITTIPSNHNSTLQSSSTPLAIDKKRIGGHVTSISISTTPNTNTTTTETQKPQIFQRGNYVTTIIGGKPMEHPPTSTASSVASALAKKQQNITKTLIKEMNGNRSDSEHDLRHAYNQQRNQYNTMLQHSYSQQHLASNGMLGNGPIKSMSSSKISINSDLGHFPIIKRERERNDKRDYIGRDVRDMRHYNGHNGHNGHNGQNGHNAGGDDDIDGSSTHSRKSTNGDGHGLVNGGRLSEVSNHHYHTNGYSSYSVEHLNGLSEYTQRKLRNLDSHLENRSRGTADIRSVKSLDFEKDATLGNGLPEKKQHQYRKHREIDYTSEPVADPLTNGRIRNGMRPTPPKKPLRLSLQRAQSLQTIEASAAAAILELDRKRAIKRTHRGGNKTPDMLHYLENGYNGGSQPHLQTASLGRHKHI